MNLAGLDLMNLIGAIVGFVLTLMIFSYLLGDNALFRLAIHIFIGVAAAFVALVTWYNVLWPQLLRPIWFWNGNLSEIIVLLIPLLLSILLLFKLTTRLAGFGSPILAYLAGVGVAAAIGGAVLGTILPQSLASVNLFSQQSLQPNGSTPNNYWFQLFNAGIILVGTLTTLAFFNFSARTAANQAPKRAAWIEFTAQVGQLFIAITFGVLFAGIYMAALTALVERSHTILTSAQYFISLFTSAPTP
jgi:hypothetical protein